MPQPTYQAWHCNCDVLCMDSQRFHQARMKKFQGGNEEMQAD